MRDEQPARLMSSLTIGMPSASTRSPFPLFVPSPIHGMDKTPAAMCAADPVTGIAGGGIMKRPSCQSSWTKGFHCLYGKVIIVSPSSGSSRAPDFVRTHTE